MFIFEFLRKWRSIDFLRLDKYILLSDKVLTTFLDYCIEKNLIKTISKFVYFTKQSVKSEFYNFGFNNNMIKNIASRMPSILIKLDGAPEQDVVSLFRFILEVPN